MNSTTFFDRLMDLDMRAAALCEDGKASETVPVLADDLRHILNILYQCYLEDQEREQARGAS